MINIQTIGVCNYILEKIVWRNIFTNLCHRTLFILRLKISLMSVFRWIITAISRLVKNSLLSDSFSKTDRKFTVAESLKNSAIFRLISSFDYLPPRPDDVDHEALVEIWVQNANRAQLAIEKDPEPFLTLPTKSNRTQFQSQSLSQKIYYPHQTQSVPRPI